jgi:hypothetical protein
MHNIALLKVKVNIGSAALQAFVVLHHKHSCSSAKLDVMRVGSSFPVYIASNTGGHAHVVARWSVQGNGVNLATWVLAVGGHQIICASCVM